MQHIPQNPSTAIIQIRAVSTMILCRLGKMADVEWYLALVLA